MEGRSSASKISYLNILLVQLIFSDGYYVNWTLGNMGKWL